MSSNFLGRKGVIVNRYLVDLPREVGEVIVAATDEHVLGKRGQDSFVRSTLRALQAKES
jgi:hypothetical protein